MSDIAWKKYIITVKYEQSDYDQKPASKPTLFYFCRSCPSFRTSVRECVAVHLSEAHRSSSSSGQEILKLNGCDNHALTPIHLSRGSCDLDRLAKHSPPDIQSSSLSPASIDSPSSASSSAPYSPSSPLSKEALPSSRKRITINLNLSTDRCSAAIKAHSEALASSTKPTVPDHTVSSSDINLGARSVYLCTECGQHFDHADPFRAHQMEHGTNCRTGKERVSVSRFVRQPVHEAIQPAEISRLQFLCGQCNRAFGSKQACEIHARKHASVKILKCKLCPSRFSSVNSLKRHLLQAHDIDPQSQFLVGMNSIRGEESRCSDSDESSENKPAIRLLHRCRTPLHRSPAEKYLLPKTRRGRPKRSSEWLLRTLENELKQSQKSASNPPLSNPVTLSNGEVCSDSRYRMILPRPSSGTTTTSAKPLTISCPNRPRRKTNRAAPGDDFQKGTFSPLLCDTVARETHPHVLTPLSPRPLSSFCLNRTVSTSTSSSLVSTDSRSTSQTDATKPPHMLTVAAAYVTQLPGSGEPASGDTMTPVPFADDRAAGSSGVVTTSSVLSTPGLPAFQLCSSWLQSPPLQSIPNSQFDHSEKSESERASNDRQSSTLSSQPAYPQPQQQQPHLQLYPVVDSDTQNTLYYVAATPMELAGGSADASYYTSYPGSQVVWISDGGSTSVDSAQSSDTVTSSSALIFSVPGDGSNSYHANTTNAISLMPGLLDTVYVSYDEADSHLDDVTEPVEVVDLDAVRCRDDDVDGPNLLSPQPTYYDISPPDSVSSNQGGSDTLDQRCTDSQLLEPLEHAEILEQSEQKELDAQCDVIPAGDTLLSEQLSNDTPDAIPSISPIEHLANDPDVAPASVDLPVFSQQS